MPPYNEELGSRDFSIARRYLDSGRYRDAVTAYDRLIPYLENHLDNPSAKVTAEVSYINRGVAHCQLGLIKKDKELYQLGINDYEKALSFEDVEDDEKEALIAYINLKYAKEEIKQFKNQP